MMADKSVARQTARKAGVAVVPGTHEPLTGALDIRQIARDVGFPLILKAVAGGGGRGMRVVRDERDLLRFLPLAQAEAQSAFSNGAVYAERYLERPRHIEVQVLADNHGKVLTLGERDCSLQRRHQKLIEEAPAPHISKKLRSTLEKSAVKIARAIGYTGVGTFEFLVDRDENAYFIEANTRVQVEHPVTEAVTGIDIIVWQIRVAAGEPLPFGQGDIEVRGHAIECRINAENAFQGFSPSTGVVTGFLGPGGPGIRIDTHLYTGYKVPPSYDSLVGKVIAWGSTRDEAIARMRRAISETVISGIETTLPFYQIVLSHPAYRAGKLDTGLVNQIMEGLADMPATVAEPVLANAHA
jgi:acetyl-CoA carboxylase biotin carboxylase subunit